MSGEYKAKRDYQVLFLRSKGHSIREERPWDGKVILDGNILRPEQLDEFLDVKYPEWLEEVRGRIPDTAR